MITDRIVTAQQWGSEDGRKGNRPCPAAYFVPDSPEWHAYEIGYLQASQAAYSHRPPLPSPPGLWALRGYEDALFDRPVRATVATLPASEQQNYQQGYTEGAAMLQRILSAPPPAADDGADDQPIFYFK